MQQFGIVKTIEERKRGRKKGEEGRGDAHRKERAEEDKRQETPGNACVLVVRKRRDQA
jgi:hypothetical protein